MGGMGDGDRGDGEGRGKGRQREIEEGIFTSSFSPSSDPPAFIATSSTLTLSVSGTSAMIAFATCISRRLRKSINPSSFFRVSIERLCVQQVRVLSSSVMYFVFVRGEAGE